MLQKSKTVKAEHQGNAHNLGAELEASPEGSSEAVPFEHLAEVPVNLPQFDRIHGLQKWIIVVGMMLGVYLTGLDTTMLSTITPAITDYFGTIKDISWYETAYVLAVCAFIPLVGRIYTIFSSKYVYICFMIIFELGSVVCAASTTSPMLIVGRAVNGVGSAGLLTGALIIITAVCEPKIRSLVTAAALSMISIGSITGPLIAGALAQQVTWRWCFWIFLPLGAVVLAITLVLSIPEESTKPPLREAVKGLHTKLDPVGFLIFAGTTTTFLLGITWGGSKYEWSSAIIIGLLCGFVGLLLAFIFWSMHVGDGALIPPQILRRRSVPIGSVVMFLQAGATQMIPYFLPFWFQAINGDSPVTSAIHMLSSLFSQIVGLVAFGALVPKFRYIPPWAILGSLSAIGSGLLTTLSIRTTSSQWIGYQIITTVGRGIAFQVPIVLIQQEIQDDESPTALAVVNLAMSFGLAVGVSAGQTIFRSLLPGLLAQYVPGLDVNSVLNAGATGISNLVPPDQLLDLITAYNLAITNMFYLPAVSSALAGIISFGLGWKRLRTKIESGANLDMSEPAAP